MGTAQKMLVCILTPEFPKQQTLIMAAQLNPTIPMEIVSRKVRLWSFQRCKGVKANGKIFDGDRETADIVVPGQFLSIYVGNALH